MQVVPGFSVLVRGGAPRAAVVVAPAFVVVVAPGVVVVDGAVVGAVVVAAAASLRTEAAGCTCTGSAASGALPAAPFFAVVDRRRGRRSSSSCRRPSSSLPFAVVVVPPAAVVVEPGFVVVVVAVPATAVYGTKSVTARNWSSAVRPDEGERLLAVLRAGQVDDDGVALAVDLGLRDAERVDPVGDDLDRGVQGREVGALHREEHDRDPALEVEAELRAAVAEQRPEEREQDQPEGDR